MHDEVEDENEHSGKKVVDIDEVVMSLEGSKITEIQCGKSHHIILTAEGAVFSYGKGEFGSLGLGGSIFEQKPRLIRKLETKIITSIACGMYHTLALSQIGDLFSWGRGFEGQLGLSTDI